MKIENFKDGILKIDGQAMSVTDAFEKYPTHKMGIYTFVKRSIREMERMDKLYHIENINKISIIKNKTIEIFKKLAVKSDAVYDQICKIFKFIVSSSNYDDKILQEKQAIYEANISLEERMNTMEITGIYKCLIENRSDCLGDSATMSFLLRCLGIDSTYVTIGDKNMENLHSIVLIYLYGHKFYCDPTTIRGAIKAGVTTLNESKILMTEKFYKEYLKQNNLKILHVYEPVKFLENGEKMKFDDEKE